ncbi:unnamed protein product [Prorocentrum cordatum]|uniref:Uncharacterized protein n=1 Tax=Prorocentrum cordatum TaxID=2364126 RepID=A0ABN9Q1B3_9DINO|nr:unnamed protein product [Polarella glacialis]
MAAADWSGESVIMVAPTMTALIMATPAIVTSTFPMTVASTTTGISAAADGNEIVDREPSSEASILVIASIISVCLSCIALCALLCWSRRMIVNRGGDLTAKHRIPELQTGAGDTGEVSEQDVADQSRMLGISLDFAISVFPEEAQVMVERFVRLALTQQSRSERTQSLLTKISVAGDLGGNVHTMNFLELADIVAHGEVAYGKGLICPRDGMLDCSIVDAVRSRGHSARATVFLSWFWQYKLSMVLSSLRKFRSRLTNPEQCFVWWCFFLNNQFRILGDSKPQDFFTLKTIFATQLRNVGRMVAMMDRVVESRYSTRLWCLFEVFTVTSEEIPFEVLLPSEASVEIDILLQQGGLGQLRSAIQVDAGQARASFEDDEKNIKSMIEDMPGAYDTLNKAVRTELRRAVEAEISLLVGDALRKSI